MCVRAQLVCKRVMWGMGELDEKLRLRAGFFKQVRFPNPSTLDSVTGTEINTDFRKKLKPYFCCEGFLFLPNLDLVLH